jgi:hypothetical protein
MSAAIESETEREGRVMRRAIGAGLERTFEATLTEQVPADWIDLLRRADQAAAVRRGH